MSRRRVDSLDKRIYFPHQPSELLRPNKNKAADQPQTSFRQVLDQKLAPELKFSRHAQERLKARNIKLDADDISRLNEAVDRARAKGSKDSLVLMNDLALVVSVKNSTVITAVNGSGLKENIFTNTDSAVII